MAVASNDADSEILYRARHDHANDEPITETIVRALAAVESVEPDRLGTRLYDSVDPEALDRLYESAIERSERLRLAFTVDDYEVVVSADGDCLVRNRSDVASGTSR
jgi:hypothetical protein